MSVSDERLAEVAAHYGPLCRKRGPNSRNKPSVRRDTYEALRELQALREQGRKDAAEIGGLRAAVTLKVGDRVVFRHPRCAFTPSDRGTVVQTQPLAVKWDGAGRSHPNPEYVFREIGPLPGGDA